MGPIVAWTDCNGIAGPVRLRALQPARKCDLIKGTLAVKSLRPKCRKARMVDAYPAASDVVPIP